MAKTKRKILVLDGVNQICARHLRKAGLLVKESSDTEDIDLGQWDGVIIRSKTKLKAKAIQQAAKGRLRLIIRAGAGVDTIDVDAATRNGVIIENTPGTNAAAVIELTMAALVAMARSLIPAHISVKQGLWEKKKFAGTELRGKTLGVIGVGKIGRGVATLAQGFGMRVLGADPMLTVERAKELSIEPANIARICKESDYITLHASLTEQSKAILGRKQFASMKKGVCIANCARAELVDRDALLDALNSGKVKYYFTDVFEQEPPPADDPLLQHKSVLATPHVGGATEESSIEGARMAAEQAAAFFNEDRIVNAVNFAPGDPQLRPWEVLAERLGSFAYQYATDGAFKTITVEYVGKIASRDTNRVTASFFAGFMRNVRSSVNIVNAKQMAAETGIDVTEAKSAGEHDQMRINVTMSNRSITLSGTCVLGRPVLQALNDYSFDIPLEDRHILISEHSDVPGIVGIIGTALGRHNINIEKMGLKDIVGRPSMAIITTREETPDAVVREIAVGVKKRGGDILLRKINL
ncbi:MAG: NAD(P)-dependent oxidoreductase [Planctomycetota bacterium]